MSGVTMQPVSGPAYRRPGVRAARLRQILAVLMLLGLQSGAQAPSSPSLLSQHSGVAFSDAYSHDDPNGALNARQIKLLNVMRQKAMVSDAEKLVALARELDADARAESGTLSPAERLHKASEIEKLARDVKDKMTLSFGSPKETAVPEPIWPR